MKNVLLTTTALVAFAGAAAADVSWSGGVDIGHNDDINGGFFYDASLNLNGTFDLGDGYSASISYGVDLESKTTIASPHYWHPDYTYTAWGTGNSGLVTDAFPTVEIIAPFGSLKGGDLNDAGASEYFYADRDGMHVDVENHDSATRFDVRALAEFGDFGVAVGGQSASGGEFSGLNFGAGGTFGDVSFGLGYDDDENGAQVTAISADMTVGGIDLGVSYASGEGIAHKVKTEDSSYDDGSFAVDGYHSDRHPSSYTVDETSIALTASMAVSSEVTVGAYVASNNATLVSFDSSGGGFDNSTGDEISGVSWGLSVAYASGPVSVSAYYDVSEAIGSEDYVDEDGDGYVVRYDDWDLENLQSTEWGIDFGYEVSADLSVFAGYFDDGAGVSYIGATYAFNDSLTGTVSWAEADEISGPEFKNGTTIMLSASF